MKTLQDLQYEHGYTTHGELVDYVYYYFEKYCEEKNKEYQSLYNDYSNHDTKIRLLRDQVSSLNYDLFHVTAERDKLGNENEERKMQMHFMQQRMDADDFQYVQDCMYNEIRKDDFEQRQP